MRRLIISFSIAIALLAPARSEAQTETPKRGGTLLFSALGEPETYDCAAAVTSVVLVRVAPHYSTLLKVDQANFPKIVGDVAESWTVSPDNLTYTFKLRPNIMFHDGSAFSAADVKASYDRMRNPPPGVFSARQQQFNDIDGIETPDANTVVFKLAKPSAAMLTYLASPFNCLYSAKRLAEDPNYPARNVMGTGPFKFVEHIAGSEWRGERFDGYFQNGKPYLDGFKVLSMNNTSQTNALIAGQIHTEFRGLGPSDRDRIVAARGADKIRVLEADSPGLSMIAFNTQRKPFDDPRVRRALSLAIDRWNGSAAMSKLVFFYVTGGFQRPNSPFARDKAALEIQPGFRPDMAANRAEAKRLLAEAGVPNLNAVFLNAPPYTPLGIYLIDQWRQIGVTVTQEFPDRQRFFASRSGGNFDMLFDTIPDFLDEPSVQLSVFRSYDKNPTNIARANDAKVDALLEQQERALDSAERKKAVSELETYLLDQAFEAPLYWARRIMVMDPAVKGFHMTPSALVGQDLADIWLAP